MKRFRFSLQALLLVREREEQVCAERYAVALQQRQDAKEAFARADANVRTTAESLRERVSRGLPAREFVQAQEHFRAVETRRRDARQALEAAERKVHAALREMLDARRRHELVERYRCKQKLRHERDAARHEARVQDELGLRKFAPARVWNGSLS